MRGVAITPEQKETMLLYRRQGMKLREIALLVGTTVNVVSKHTCNDGKGTTPTGIKYGPWRGEVPSGRPIRALCLYCGHMSDLYTTNRYCPDCECLLRSSDATPRPDYRNDILPKELDKLAVKWNVSVEAVKMAARGEG